MLAAVTSNALSHGDGRGVYGYFLEYCRRLFRVAGLRLNQSPTTRAPVERPICGSGYRGGTDYGGSASVPGLGLRGSSRLANTSSSNAFGHVAMALPPRAPGTPENQQLMVAEGGNRQIGRQTAALLQRHVHHAPQ